MSRFDEHTCSSSRGSVCWVADRRCGLSTAWVVVSRVRAAILVLVVTKVAVFRPFGSGVAAVVDVRATPKSNSMDNVRALQGDTMVLEDAIKL